MTKIETLRKYYNNCNPEKPITVDDPDNLYIDFDEKKLRGAKCIDAIAKTIQLSEQPTTQLFTGFPGAGKTSELFRLERQLSEQGYLVVYADCTDTIDTLNPIEYSDVLIALGLAVDEHLAQLKDENRFVQWTQKFGDNLKELLLVRPGVSDISLQFGGEIGSANIGLELRKNPNFRSIVREAADSRRRQFLEEVQQFFSEADEAARENGFESGLVVILDNLEKLSMDPDSYYLGRDMLLHHADALRQPNVHLVYTIPAPFVFSSWGPQLGRIYDNEPQVLSMVKVHERQSGKPYTKGLQELRELLLRRVGFEEVFASDDSVVDLLIQNCGGYARDLLRLVQYSLQDAWNLPVQQPHVKAAIKVLERSYRRGFNTDDIELLEYVLEHRPQNIPEEFKDRLEEVMFSHYVMIYANDVEWYGVHPIVERFIQK